MSYAAAVLADNPLIYWRLGEASGTTAVDASGNGNDGTYNGAVALGETGFLTDDPNTAVRFDGVGDDQFVEGNDDVGNTTYPEFTLECIASFDSGHEADGGIIAVIRDATYAHFIEIYQGGSAGSDTLISADWQGVGSIEAAGDFTLTPDTPVHIVFTYDGVMASLYRDGALAASFAVASNDADFAGVSAFLYAGGDGVGFNPNLTGVVDEVAFYTTALSAARAAEHYAQMIAPTGPVTPPVVGGFSDAQIIELQFGGQRQDRFTFPLLNPDRSPLGASLDAHVDSAPSIQVQTQRTSFRTCSGLIVDDPPDDLDLSRVRVQPTLTLANGSHYELGVLMFGLDARNIYATGEQWTPELFDETFLLNQDLSDTWSIGAGGSVLDLFVALADEILGPLGIPADYEIDDVAAASPLVFKVGTSRNAALVALSALLGALPPFFDNRGTYRLKPAPQGLASDHSYEIGTRIFDSSTVVSSSVYKAPNRYIVVGDDVGGTPVRGVFDLPDAAGNSFASTGQRVTAPVHTVSGVKSVELATQIAYVDALTDQTTYGTAAFAAAADPRHDIFDTVTLLGVQYMETGWTLACTSGGDMSHALSRLWA